MNFNDLEKDSTLQDALMWVANCIQNSILSEENKIDFTFKPNENNSLNAIFEFVLKIKDNINKYGFNAWVVLNNTGQSVMMRIVLKEQRRN